MTAAGEDYRALGAPLTAAQIARVDSDLAPSGRIPAGSGDAEAGAVLYAQRCQHCHGEQGRGVPFDALAPTPGLAPSPRLIGVFWPYATTLYDYIARAMPQQAPGSLTPDQAYALTAYLLFLNDLVDADQRIDGAFLRGLVMPARDRFDVSREARALVPGDLLP